MNWPWVSRRKMEQTRLWDYREMRSRSKYAERCAAREGYAKGLEAAHRAVTELLDDEDIKCCTDHTMPVRQALTAIDDIRRKTSG